MVTFLALVATSGAWDEKTIWCVKGRCQGRILFLGTTGPPHFPAMSFILSTMHFRSPQLEYNGCDCGTAIRTGRSRS